MYDLIVNVCDKTTKIQDFAKCLDQRLNIKQFHEQQKYETINAINRLVNNDL